MYPAHRITPKARATYYDNQQRRAKEIAFKAELWHTENPAESRWLHNNANRSNFAESLLAAVAQWGKLTERQLAAVQRIIADEPKREAERAERAASAPVVSVDAIERAFASAQEKGIKRPKMRLADFRFALAPATGRNAGAIYVTEGDEYLGKISGGRFFGVATCPTEKGAEVVAVASDPHQAAVAYGRRTGSCAICARELTNHASIDLGIGPICAAKYGWG